MIQKLTMSDKEMLEAIEAGHTNADMTPHQKDIFLQYI